MFPQGEYPLSMTESTEAFQFYDHNLGDWTKSALHHALPESKTVRFLSFVLEINLHSSHAKAN